MTELHPQGLVITAEETTNPDGFQVENLKPLPGSLESLHRYKEELNKFLVNNGLRDDEFRFSELPITPAGSLVLHSPDNMMAIMVEDKSGLVNIRHCPRLFKEMLTWQNIEYEEVPYVHPIGNGLVMVSFPMDPGPPELGAPPQELLMTMIMEDNSQPPTEPVCLIGNFDEMTRLAQQSPQFKPIKLTQEQFDQLTAHYLDLEKKYGGKQVPLSPNLISETSNVTQVDQFSASRKFHSVLTFYMKDGSVRNRLVNRGEINQETGELQEASCYLITTQINGKKHVVVAQMKRVNGHAKDSTEAACEIPRGFSRKPIQSSKFVYQLGTGETGIPGETLMRYQVNRQETMSSDGTLEDVDAEVVEINLPDDIVFMLENKQQNEPLKEVEQLAPTWMSLSDALRAIKEGKVFAEAFSIALLAKWFFAHEILTLKDQDINGNDTSHLAMAMEVVQDYRNGGSKLTIWRDDSSQFDQLTGTVNPNNGINRRWHHIGHAHNLLQSLTSAKKTWQAVSLPQLVEGIKTLRWDNVTIAAIFKMLLQQGLLKEHLEKLSA